VTLREQARNAPLHASVDSDERTEAFANLNRHVLLMRGLGAALLIGGWAYFTLPRFGSAMFFADTVVFLILGSYAFVAAYTARRETIALEKKLRLSLIMRNMELEGGATRDALTHMFNRGHFFDRLERELQTAKGVRRPLSVVVVDLNGIEEINRNHGYRTGDKVLASFGKFLLDQARASDVPARIGGDKFAIILPDTAEPAANAAVNRLLQALDKLPEFETADVSIKLTARAAASGHPWDADTVDTILHRATEKSHALERA
jgi:diguanylate cyclase (GGDEF)-like protein